MKLSVALFWFSIGFGLILLSAALGYPHGGGLDSDSCHHDWKHREYHWHKGDLGDILLNREMNSYGTGRFGNVTVPQS